MQAKTMKAPQQENRWERISWCDDYSVGNDEIDTDHKKLFDLFNNFVNAVNEERADSEIQSVLADLVEYTDYHFDREERQMRDAGYPDYASHKKTHDDFVRQMLDINNALDAGGEPGAYVLTVLGKWLTDHILGVDMDVGMYLREHEATQAKAA